MSFSSQLFDLEFDVAHLLKIASYICVLTGLIVSIQSVFRDADAANSRLQREIIEKTRAEEELKAHEEELAKKSVLLETTLESMAQGIVVYDADEKLVASNKHFNEMIGVSPDFIRPGMTLNEIRRLYIKAGHFGTEDEDALVTERSSWVQGVSERTAERTFPNGVTIVYHRQAMPDGGTVVTYTDITERKLAQNALKESEERLSAVVNYSPAKIHIKDAEGRYILINRVSEKLFGVTDEEARGKTTHDIFAPGSAAKFVSHDRAVLETGQVVADEEEWPDEDGIRTFLTVKFPIRDASGQISAIGAIGTDITKRKEAEREAAENHTS